MLVIEKGLEKDRGLGRKTELRSGSSLMGEAKDCSGVSLPFMSPSVCHSQKNTSLTTRSQAQSHREAGSCHCPDI